MGLLPYGLISRFDWQSIIVFAESSVLLQIVNDKVTRIRRPVKKLWKTYAVHFTNEWPYSSVFTN